MSSFRQLVYRALEDGWAVDDGDLRSVESQATSLGWEVVASRKAGPLTEVLKPTATSDARTMSLSAKYGTGGQPLHTDGAHHVRTPDVVLLSAENPSDVPTLLWKFSTGRVPKDVLQSLRNGLFTVRSGKDAFLAPALDGTRLRFDPGCMGPSDQRARLVMAFFESARESAERQDWTTSGKVLAIDNRRVLHARASAEGEPDRAMQRVTLKRIEGRQ
jgi:Taurine catabolism dioxygenase TauD, TfdA family